MNIDLQKANIWKRVSAFLFDSLLLGIVAVGVGFLLSSALHYDRYSETLHDAYDKYETAYSIEFEITGEEYEAMSEGERIAYDTAYNALLTDEEAMQAYNMTTNLTMLIITFSVLISFVILEFVVPLKLKNGQTIGKKIFGLGVMRTDAVSLTTIQLFIRTVLGKFTIETMIPIYIFIMIFFHMIGVYGTLGLCVLAVIQLIILSVTNTRSLIHDLLAGTVVIDITSQKIFKDMHEMLEYKKKLHAEKVATEKY